MVSDTAERMVLLRQQGRIGRITLNRPRALNALNLEMIRSIAAALAQWRDEPAIHAVVIEGAGGRAFCAGGDIREIRRMTSAGDHAGVETFFREEYALNLAIARYPKPYVSLIDGICMGGGIGLSVHGAVRLATESATFAMPETAIGLFPDVGATFVLPRLRGCYGMYMALTGARASGADAVWLGLATHLVPSTTLPGLADAMAADGLSVLADFAVLPVPGEMPARDVSSFGMDSVGEIVSALTAQTTPFAQETLTTLRQVSPSSLLWTFEALQRGATQTLEACLAAELALTAHVTRHPDFSEGVRAMVVDKDRTPRWAPGRIEDVDPGSIAAMFP